MNILGYLLTFRFKLSIVLNWIAIDRSKRGPSNHKAFLTKDGKKIIEDRKKDFELIFLMKESDSYGFTSESNHFHTKDLNRVMRSVLNQFTE